MRPSRFSDEQIVEALREVRTGTPAASLCRRLGITETTFYRWRREHTEYDDGSREAAELSEVRALRSENHKLREIVANLLLEKLT